MTDENLNLNDTQCSQQPSPAHAAAMAEGKTVASDVFVRKVMDTLKPQQLQLSPRDES